MDDINDPTDLHHRVLSWYADHARDLPWRRSDATPWGVLVSEIMLQQTPVARVTPVWEEWMRTWPTPADLASVPAGEAVRAWGKLGYPRRALRLHAAAQAIVDQHGGEVPSSYDELLALPGIGDYTAAAVASFAFGRRHVVLDTNVRRVLTRVLRGAELPSPSVTRAERELATDYLPDDDRTAAAWAVGVMELGALVCTAARPACARCPLADSCAWQAAGRPSYDGPVPASCRRISSWYVGSGLDPVASPRTAVGLARTSDSIASAASSAAEEVITTSIRGPPRSSPRAAAGRGG